jgi:hypothetical protein
MKIRLSIRKADARLHQGDYEVVDAKTFGAAFVQAWNEMQARRLGKTTSVGAFMDALSESELEELDGAEFTVRKL